MSSMYSEVSLGQLIRLKNDKSKQLKSTEYLSSGGLAIVDQSKELICGYTNDLNKRFDKGLPVTIFGDHTLHVKFIDFDFAIGADGTQVISCKDSENNEKYLYYLINHASSLITSQGYSRHFKILKEFCVPFTLVRSEQQKIASILTSVDTVIEKTEAQINKLKDLKKAMMQELLTKGIGHTEFKDSPVGRIPVSWEVLPIKQIAKVQGGYAFKSNDAVQSGMRWLKIANVGQGKAIWNDISFLPMNYKNRHPEFVLHEDDIVVAMTRPVLNGNLKVTELKKKDVPSLLNQRVGRIISNEIKINKRFLYVLFRTKGLSDEIEKIIFGTDPPNISGTQIESIIVPVPPLPEQQKIASILTSVENNIDEKQNTLHHTKSLKKALMQDLLTGKVRVAV